MTVAVIPPARAHSDGVSASLIRRARARTSAIGAHPPAAARDVDTLRKLQKTCNNGRPAAATQPLQTDLRSAAGVTVVTDRETCQHGATRGQPHVPTEQEGAPMQRGIFTPEHDAFRDMVRTFIAREITPYHEQWERDG